MSDREAFVAAIAANPHDDLPRLVFADWLDEHGDPERAEFIRTQIRWHHTDADERKQLDQRAGELFREHWMRWFGPLLSALEPEFPSALWSDVQYAKHPAAEIGIPNYPPTMFMYPRKVPAVGFTVRRGFVTGLGVDVGQWWEKASLADAFQYEPVCDLSCAGGLHSPNWMKFTDPCLRRIESLKVNQQWAWNISAPESTAFLEDPHLAGVRRLELWANAPDNQLAMGNLPAAWLERFVRSSLAYRLNALTVCRVHADGIRPLCRPGRLRLERLNLTGGLTPETAGRMGASELAGTIRELRWQSAEPGDAAVAALTRDDWRKLTRLDLGHNSLTAAVLPALASAAFTPRLKKLDLSHNPLFDGTDLSGLQRLSDALDPERLEHLDLTDTGLSHVPDFLGERFGERVTV